MSEPAAKPRPMIDLDEFERRLRRPAAAPHPHEDPLTELARLVGGHEDPFKNVFDRERLPPRVAPVPVSTPRVRPVDPPLPEAFEDEDPRFHSTIHPQNYAEEPVAANPDYAWADMQPPAAPMAAQAANLPPRSRRPLFVMAGIILLGIAGIGASFAYKSKSGPHEIATINAMSGPTKIQPESSGGTDVPNQTASILDKNPQSSPVGLSNHREQPVDLAQAATLPRTAMADASGTMGAASVPVPTPPGGQAQQNIQSYGLGALIEPKKVKTVSVRSDGTLLPNDTPPQMPSSVAPAAPSTNHASAPTAATTPKPVTPKSTARVVTTPKPQSIEQLADDGNNAPVAATPAKPKVAPAKPVKVAETETTNAIPEQGAAVGSGFAVQFSAPASEQEAHEMTAKLSSKFSSELSGHHLTYHRAKVGDKTVFRVRTSGLTHDEATSICQKVQGSGGSCFVAKD